MEQRATEQRDELERLRAEVAYHTDMACQASVALAGMRADIEKAGALREDIGESVTCPHCSGEHTVFYGERVLPNGSREPSRTLGFYRCGDKSYLCAIEGRSVMEKFR